ncbi:MAG: hypothetical protein H0W90_07995 [Actinobacteria bacterium]|nr:hypothetical protein [Actinomycetota bacterium]
MESELEAEVDARLRLASILGAAAQRKALRRRLGLTIVQMSDLTGLHPASVAWRETDRWLMTRGSIESDAGWAYVRLLARCKGISIDD